MEQNWALYNTSEKDPLKFNREWFILCLQPVLTLKCNFPPFSSSFKKCFHVVNPFSPQKMKSTEFVTILISRWGKFQTRINSCGPELCVVTMWGRAVSVLLASQHRLDYDKWHLITSRVIAIVCSSGINGSSIALDAGCNLLDFIVSPDSCGIPNSCRSNSVEIPEKQLHDPIVIVPLVSVRGRGFVQCCCDS